MTKEQMKMFFSQNFILNSVKMMRFLKQMNKEISIKQILKKFGDLSDPTLDFQLKKYPQKKKIFIRPQIQNMVEMCQNNEDPQYDILTNMNFHYQYDQNGFYYRQIKLMINKMISLTNQHFQSYQEQMKKIFTQHQIGRKINQNTPQFEKHQIITNKITIQNPQIMRIIIKWIQELEDKIQNFEKNIDNRYYPFPHPDGDLLRYSKSNRQQISNSFKQYLSQHKQYKLQKNLEMLQNIENQMINYIDTNSKSFTYISQNNIEVGLATHLLSETVQQIAIKRLNQVIHSILSFQQQYKYHFGKVNYITFSVYDLLRSRCSGSYQKIKLIYAQLKNNTNFKIIRVKNRLTTGNRDFLINMKFKNTPIICELQLGLILENSSINQKQDRLGDFNHFLYELKRSKYGPLTQAVLLNAYYSQSINFFQQKLKKIKFQKERKMKIQTLKPKICNDEIQISGYEIQDQQIIFVCHNCLQVKYTKTTFLNTYKKMKIDREGQFQYLCGECVVNSLQIFDRNKYLLGEYTQQFFQQTNQNEILKNDQIIGLCYYLIISTNRRRYIVRKLEEDYFIQCFSSLVSQNYQFLNINQLSIKYVYRLAKWINQYVNMILVYNMQGLNQRAYINQYKRQFLINNKEKWKQAVYIKGKKGCLLIDATKQQYGRDYKSNLNLFIKTKQIKQFKQSKLQYMDLESYTVDQEFFQKNLKEVKQIKKLNLSDNNLTEIYQIIKGKNILELKLNYNKILNVIIPIQSLIKLQIKENGLKDIDVSALINLQILDISYNRIQNIKLDKLVKLRQLNLYGNKLSQDCCFGLDKLVKLQQLNLSFNHFKQVTLPNRQYQKLYLSANPLTKFDISKMEKLKELYIDQNHFEKLVLENPSLEILDISGNQYIKQLDIQKLFNLKKLIMKSNHLQNLTLNNSKLQYLDMSQNQLTSVNFKTVISLKHLYLTENKLQQLCLDYPFLETLYVNKNQLQKLDLSKLVNLKELYANQNNLTQFPEINMKSIQKLHLHENKLKKINLNKQGSLRELDISYNQIDEFIVGNLALQKIQAKYNKIKKVDITKLNEIRQINFSFNKIQQIVLENKSLQIIELSYNRINNINLGKLINLKQVYINNNCIQSIKITKYNNPKLKKIILNNYNQRYVQYFIKELLTEYQVTQYKQQKQKTEAGNIQILNKLGFYPIITKETFSGIIFSIKDQYNNEIDIHDMGL